MAEQNKARAIEVIRRFTGNNVPDASKTPIVAAIAKMMGNQPTGGSPYAYPKTGGADVSYHGMLKVASRETPGGVFYDVISPTNQTIHTSPNRDEAERIARETSQKLFGIGS